VADALGIPYYVINLREVFERTVVDPFVAEYARGRTPHPCIACNRYVKFEALLAKALELECDYVATGHYARVERDPATGRYLLRKGADPRKDQSYVLYSLRQEQLARVLFPVGGMRKPEVRRRAAELGLVVADKPDSQELCFVPDGDYGALIAQRVPEAVSPGPIYDLQGNRLGSHRGLPFYTVGQRRGLGLSSREPLYVVAILPEENALVVGTAEEAVFGGLVAAEVNWVALEGLDGPRPAAVRIRSRAPDVPATLLPLEDGRVEVRFASPQRAVAPGQAAVFYEGDLLLGGGVIERALAA
jgi:tRNA-specific 2-thiouridylase